MKHLLFFLLFATSIFAQSGGQPINIPIQNSSFDQIPTGTYNSSSECGHQFNGIPSWGGVGDPGVWTFQISQANPCNIPLPPDGSMLAAGISNTMISQDTGVKASSLQSVSRNGLYTMTFSVLNFFNVYPGYFEGKVYLASVDAQGHYDLSAPSSHELCSPDGWAMQTWQQVTYTCLAPQYLIFAQWPMVGSAPASDPDAHIIVALSEGPMGWSLLFKKVSLTFTPSN